MAMSDSESVTWAFRVADTTLDDLSDSLDIAQISADGLSEENGVATAWFSHRPVEPMPTDGWWEPVRQADWSEVWKEGLQPITVGAVTITVPWLAPAGPSLGGNHHTIVIEPGMAFGTGHHETTKGCLQAMQDLDLTGARVVDVGTGTGILALAAIALGAAEVIAFDTDPVAVAVARENILAHGVPTTPPTGVGRPGWISLKQGSCEVVDGQADLVIANIITDKLMHLAPDLVALVAPGGTLLTSGVAVGRENEAIAAFGREGLPMTGLPGREWAILSGMKHS